MLELAPFSPAGAQAVLPDAQLRPRGWRKDIHHADKVGHEERARVGINLRGHVELFEMPSAHHGDAVGQAEGLFLVMGDEDGGDLDPALDGMQFFAQAHAQQGVQVAERLVQQQDLGFQHQRAGQRHALLLAAGKLRRIAPAVTRQPDQFERTPLLRDQFLPWACGAGAGQRRYCRTRACAARACISEIPWPSGGGWAGYPPPRRRRSAHPRRWLLKPADHAQGRGLAAAGRPKDAHELTVAHAEVDVVDGGNAAELLGQALQVRVSPSLKLQSPLIWRRRAQTAARRAAEVGMAAIGLTK